MWGLGSTESVDFLLGDVTIIEVESVKSRQCGGGGGHVCLGTCVFLLFLLRPVTVEGRGQEIEHDGGMTRRDHGTNAMQVRSPCGFDRMRVFF